MFDWDKDGKVDHNDAYIFHEIFDTKKSESDAGGFPTLRSSGSYTPATPPQVRQVQTKKNNSQNHGSTELYSLIGQLCFIVLCIMFFWMLLNDS